MDLVSLASAWGNHAFVHGLGVCHPPPPCTLSTQPFPCPLTLTVRCSSIVIWIRMRKPFDPSLLPLFFLPSFLLSSFLLSSFFLTLKETSLFSPQQGSVRFGLPGAFECLPVQISSIFPRAQSKLRASFLPSHMSRPLLRDEFTALQLT